MAKTAKKVTEPVTESKDLSIKSTIEVSGHTNPFITYYNDNDVELKSVGYIKMPGANNYVSYTITTIGGKVTEILCDEPNLKMIAEESAKIAFVQHFVDKEDF